jgi:hypothetical protein
VETGKAASKALKAIAAIQIAKAEAAASDPTQAIPMRAPE